MARITRAAGGAAIALALTLAVALPAAAAQPVRTVISAGPATYLLTAGHFCDFDVLSEHPLGDRFTIWDSSNGREALTGSVIRRTLTNVATGAKFVAPTNAHEVDWYDPNSPLVHGVATGEFIYQLVPGDVGPDGVVVNRIEELFVQGQASYVFDGNTFATLSLTISGTTTEICTALSG